MTPEPPKTPAQIEADAMTDELVKLQKEIKDLTEYFNGIPHNGFTPKHLVPERQEAVKKQIMEKVDRVEAIRKEAKEKGYIH
jgi:hypothetical protein